MRPGVARPDGGDPGAGGDPGTGGDPGNGVETAHGGLDLGEWMSLYWQSALGGEQGGSEQDRIFLPLPAGADRDGDMIYTGETDVTMSASDGFVLPMFVWIGETYENGDPVDDDPSRRDDHRQRGR